MNRFSLRLGICGLFALAFAGQVGAQDKEPPVITPPVVKPGQGPVTPIVVMDQLGLNPGYCGPCLQGPCLQGPCLQVPPPIFRTSASHAEDILKTECLVTRAINLGTFGFNYKKLADTLEKGVAPADAPANPPKAGALAPNGIQLASNAQDVALQAGKDAPQPVDPKLIDELNRVMKTQADLIRSLDIGSLNRPGPFRPYPYGPYGACPWACPYGGPYGGPYGPYPGYPYRGSPVVCSNGVCTPGCALVLTGRTGLELAVPVAAVQDFVNLPRTQGLYIKEVYPKTPAEAAGYKKNDLLIEFDGKKVPSGLFEFLEQIFHFVKNDTPINGVVLRAGQRVEINGMTITDRRVIPALPHECPLDWFLPHLVQTVPGINPVAPNTNVVRELRAVPRPGGITEYIWVEVPAPPAEKK
jgi:hypothetical protein